VKVFNGIADLQEAVGSHLGYSDWLEVTQDRIGLFAEATGDHQWIHVDRLRAASGPFGTTIAHGFLTLSLLPMLVAQVYALHGVRMGVNYGTDKVRFPTPVPVGSKVRAGVELVGVRPNSLGYLVTTRITVERHGSRKPACVAESLAVVVP